MFRPFLYDVSMPSRLKPLVVVVAFLTCLIAVGHGVGPLGFLLVIGDFIPSPIRILGFAAVVILLTSALLSGQPAKTAKAVGVVVALIVWVCFLSYSEPAATTILFSLHFLASIALLFSTRYDLDSVV